MTRTLEEARESYRQVVGDQAVELERRMQAGGARIVLTAGPNGWLAEVSLARPELVVVAQAPMMSTALWLASTKAGLTEGLNPPGAR